MKKFDFFLILVAMCLIGVGYYFAKEFKPEAPAREISGQEENAIKKIIPSLRQKFKTPEEPPRLPSGSKVEASSVNPDKAFHQKYLELKNCLRTEACDFGKEDPRAYELNVLSSINEHLTDVDMLSASYLEKLLKDAVQFSSGHIKKTVLNHLNSKDIYDASWRDIILNEYISYHDAHLIPEALEYLKSNVSEQDKQMIHTKLLQEIAYGSPMVANALVENLKGLLDSSSVEYYKQGVANMAEGPIKDSLKREIRDFELELSAG
ncbi:MAG: hypothetical protein M9899_09055 [Bdellovibrionaceae bacterium]|nr:hypothetical protein [Pseudobdellovibrionaceae bacterium]